MVQRIQCAVIGAGVVGLAIARALAMIGREVIILEQASAIGSGISSRNSEVIHAGIYYPKDSIRAKTCVRGKKLLYEYCTERSINHSKVKKLIVATSTKQLALLNHIKKCGFSNGVNDLKMLSVADVRLLEPEVHCEGAILSPSTGIVDTHDFMVNLLADSESYGSVLALKTEVKKAIIDEGADTTLLFCQGTSSDIVDVLECDIVVNCAGLTAPSLARQFVTSSGSFSMIDSLIPNEYFAKGSYFGLRGVHSPFRHLIYPVPEAGGLGVHATLDLNGLLRFGPDVEWVKAPNFVVDPQRADVFYSKIRKYWPSLPDGSLVPDYAGIRPKIYGPDDNAVDFSIIGPIKHKLKGVVHMFGIESPGLTASMALAELVLKELGLKN